MFGSYIVSDIENYMSNEYNESKICINKDSILEVTSNGQVKAECKIDDIKLQNRAGRGNNIIMLVFDDYVKDVSIV